jgi:hypothetical protein
MTAGAALSPRSRDVQRAFASTARIARLHANDDTAARRVAEGIPRKSC